MIAEVRLGEPFWRAIGVREVRLTLCEGATVADALAALVERYPALARDLRGGEAAPALFVGDEMAAPESRLTDGAQLHIVWPVSGG